MEHNNWEFDFIKRHDKGEFSDPVEAWEYISHLLTEVIKETEKAFGGCKNCYGKGYSTTKVQAGNSRHGIWELDPIRPCDCDRGKQIALLINK